LRTECLPQTGWYQIVCRDADSFDAGSYTLRMLQSPGPIPPGKPSEYLQISHCAEDLIVRWPTNAVGYRLQTTDLFLNAPDVAEWSELLPPYFATGGFYFFTNSSGSNHRFFRLIKP
jgi:hypothetical protein